MAELKEFADDLLHDDPSGRGRAQLQDELVQMKATLKRELDQGVSAEEAALLRALDNAVDAANVAVDSVWQRFNG